MKKFKVAIIGATGYVGQTFACLLSAHPWFEPVSLFASTKSAGKTYQEAVIGRWAMAREVPANLAQMQVYPTEDLVKFKRDIDFVFCAVNMPKPELVALEETIAKLEIPVISNNSANRWTQDVPMVLPEVNPDHVDLIPAQRRRLGTQYGFIAVKPNCSIQSYVPILTPLRKYGLEQVQVATYQAISGAGKTFKTWPEMDHNLIPYIAGEEEKSEREPLKVWGRLNAEKTAVELSPKPVISAQCYRVAVENGHTAAISVKFSHKPSPEEMIEAWTNYRPYPQEQNLPSAPQPFLQYLSEPDRPQVIRDRDFGAGMGVSIGRLREDNIFDYKLCGLSHNTIRGAAGGAILLAELLVVRGYLKQEKE